MLKIPKYVLENEDNVTAESVDGVVVLFLGDLEIEVHNREQAEYLVSEIQCAIRDATKETT